MENLNNLTLWDVKDVFNKVKNVVMNYTEMEAKVREATNNEPWGASSTLMQEIAQGTYSYQHFNEIMPTIYKRFLEKEARQWRQIYKALQLLEYLVKHGSERVVDDARAHMTTIKVMRNFAFIDEKGKDQGINVRNRAREFTELLSDVEKIRAERKKAKANRSKYTGVSSDTSGSYGSYSRYGGFGGSGNESYSYNEDRSRSRYDDPDWQSDYRIGRVSPSDDRRSSIGNTNRFSQGSTKKSTESSTINTIEQKNEVNLFDFDETPDSISTPSQNARNSQNITDFEFQSAPNHASSSQRSSINSVTLQSLQPLQTTNFTGLNNNPNSGVNNNLLDDLLGPVSSVPVSSVPVSSVPISSFPVSSVPAQLSQNSNLPPVTNSTHSTFTPNSSKMNSATAFKNSTNSNTTFPAIKSDDIWASSLVDLGSLGKEKNNNMAQPSKPSMNSLVQTGTSSWDVKGTWTTGRPVQQNQNGAQKPLDQFDSLL
ncbi:6544_t:CDS:2 [Diversispora eburnea]|uniref:6544_t:CDS:1 n=1 Tax=Diversispora eburnea TaxID=1213867 RepID=A0A9N8YQ23_9GLOM|nr:6544_t:CDS:2 [Diversispora eburnea]